MKKITTIKPSPEEDPTSITPNLSRFSGRYHLALSAFGLNTVLKQAEDEVRIERAPLETISTGLEYGHKNYLSYDDLTPIEADHESAFRHVLNNISSRNTRC